MPLYVTGTAIGPKLPVVPEIYEATRVNNINELPLSGSSVLNTQTNWNQFDSDAQFQVAKGSKKRKIETLANEDPLG